MGVNISLKNVSLCKFATNNDRVIATRGDIDLTYNVFVPLTVEQTRNELKKLGAKNESFHSNNKKVN